jgi:hypothetical protein
MEEQNSIVGMKICDYYCKKEEQEKCPHYPFSSPGLFSCCPHIMGPGCTGSSGVPQKHELSTRRQFSKK